MPHGSHPGYSPHRWYRDALSASKPRLPHNQPKTRNNSLSMENTKPEYIISTLEKQKMFFATQTTKNLSYRKEALKKLLRSVEEHEQLPGFVGRFAQIIRRSISYRNFAGEGRNQESHPTLAEMDKTSMQVVSTGIVSIFQQNCDRAIRKCVDNGTMELSVSTPFRTAHWSNFGRMLCHVETVAVCSSCLNGHAENDRIRIPVRIHCRMSRE